MKPVVGLELTGKRICAVTVSRVMHRTLRRFEIPWKTDSIDEAVVLLREHLGGVSAIGIAIGMEFLLPKHLKLPPVSALEKRRMISLEPERFFPVSAPLIVSASGDHDLVFGAEASPVERWLTALEQWGPVQNVEASPSAFARAARALKLEDGLYSMPAGANDTGYAQIQRSRLTSARRARAGSVEADAREIPESDGVPGPFLPALGAALGVGGDPDQMLVSTERHARIRANRNQSMTFAGLLAVVSLALVLLSASYARQRYLDRIGAETAAMKPRAATAQALQGRIDLMGLASTAANVAQRAVDPLSVITILSQRLPRDVVVMTVRGASDEWQISGTASDAASIIPALDADPALENIRFLAGTSRFTEGRRTYETFSIGFRVVQSSR